MVSTEKTKKDGEPEAVAIIQWGAEAGKVKTAIEKACTKAVEKDQSKRSKEKYKSYEIVTLESKTKAKSEEEGVEIKPDGMGGRSEFAYGAENEEEVDSDNEFTMPGGAEENEPEIAAVEPKAQEKTVYAFVNDVLLVSDSVDLIKFVISHIDGASGGTLAEAGKFDSVVASVGPAHDIDVWVNMPAVLAVAATADKSGQAKMQLANFGLDNLGDAALAVGIGRGENKPLTAKGVLKVNGEKRGIIKMLEPVSQSLSLPKFIDPSAAAVSSVNLNFGVMYQELFNLLNNISPGGAAALNVPLVPADQEGQGGVELKKDVIDYLGSQLLFAETIKKPFTDKMDSMKISFAIAAKDAKALEKSLSLVHERYFGQGKADAKREFMSSTIYKLGTMSFLPIFGGASSMADESGDGKTGNGAAFAVTGGYLIIGAESDIEEAIRLLNNKEAAAIGSAPWLARARQGLPEKTGVVSLKNEQASMEYLWWVFKNAKSGTASPDAIMLGSLKDTADFKLLPDFEKVKKYFGVSSSYIVSRPDGFFFESQILDVK